MKIKFKKELFILIFDEMYIVDHGGSVQGLGKSGHDHCLQIFYFFFLDKSFLIYCCIFYAFYTVDHGLQEAGSDHYFHNLYFYFL